MTTEETTLWPGDEEILNRNYAQSEAYCAKKYEAYYDKKYGTNAELYDARYGGVNSIVMSPGDPPQTLTFEPKKANKSFIDENGRLHLDPSCFISSMTAFWV